MSTKGDFSGFPFIYGDTILFDELKFRAYRQQVFRYQKIAEGKVNFNPSELEKYKLQNAKPEEIKSVAGALAFEAGQKMNQSLKDANIKRDSFFTPDSIHQYFDLKAQLTNYGWLGKLIASIFKRNY